MPLLYAYLINQGGRTRRHMITFSSREVADEWWRIVSTAPSPWANNIQRTSPQFYTHVPYPVPISEFFLREDFTLARQFLGKMFFTLLNEGYDQGCTLSIAPPIDFTDHVSGNWFFIRSKSDPRRYWYAPTAQGMNCAVCCGSCGRLHVSSTRRTRFRIQIRNSNLPAGTIMIGTDQVTISVSNRSFVVISDGPGSSNLVTGTSPGSIRFGDFQTTFKAIEDANLAETGASDLIREDIVRVAEGGEPWELV